MFVNVQEVTSEEVGTHAVSFAKLDTLAEAATSSVPFELDGKVYELALNRKPIISDKSEFILLSIWDEQDAPVAYVDCILLCDSHEALIDFKAHNYAFRDNPELLRHLDAIYTEDDKKSEKEHAAFFINASYRGTGMADLLQAQTKYLLHKLGANRIVYAGDTTVKINDSNPTSFYARNATEWQLEINPVYEDGAPYNGPRTTVSTELNSTQTALLAEMFS
jgi:hypothetical protein